MPMSSRRGARVTTVDAYLALGATPPNLTVLCDTTVGALVVTRGRAVGVRLLDGTTIEADRVVVCAGTYGSPLLLMRSGIGPAAHLRELGIPVVADLRGVGENLADHPACYVECGRLTPERQQPALHLIATFHSEGRPSTETPDLMFWIADPAGPASAQSSFDIDIVLLRPDSRGRVRLRSPDPVDPPIIELPRLDLRVDIQRLAEAHRRAVMVANCPQVRDVCDGPAVAELSAADLDDYLPREAYSIPHTVGTCAMGRDPDGGAVVDASLGVHGVEALNVVDASVMPDAPSGFTQVPTIMIAERFADRFADS
jgi:choline dehydrogenase